MDFNATLVVMAAGMGSRYGTLKQLDGVGPSGETIMDYSIYDAVRAGFGKVVFVIRRDFEKDFNEKILSKYKGVVDVATVFQSLDCLPAGYSVPEGREKPWGTNHAVLMGKDVIKEPFAVINADDFYGKECTHRPAERLLEDGDTVSLGDEEINVISTPGHSPGSICLLCHGECEDFLVSGDTLFSNSVGRWDLWGGDAPTLARSLARLRELDGSMRIYAGHGEDATLGSALENAKYYLDF